MLGNISPPYRTFPHIEEAMTLTKTQTTSLTVAGFSIATVAVLSQGAIAAEKDQFTDVSLNYWARPYIEQLAQRNIIAGFPNGTFKPTEPVTRAQFAAILRQAFDQSRTREYRSFSDVSSDSWAVPAIKEAYETGFMSGYANGQFRPEQKIPRVQALVSIASGLRLRPDDRSVNASLNQYLDAAQIPEYARPGVAAATQNSIVVNYPNLKYLNPNEVTTRADVAAFIYQALVDQGTLSPLASNLKANDYVVTAPGSNVETPPSVNEPVIAGIVRGTKIQVKAPGAAAVRYAIVPGETYATNLVVAQNVLNREKQVVIPKGSTIQGAFRPVRVQSGNSTEMATRYVARSIKIGSVTYTLSATSSPRLATRPSEVQSEDANATLETSDAARAILQSISPNLSNTLFGSPEAETADSNESKVILINPEKDLDLTVRSTFGTDTAGNASQ